MGKTLSRRSYSTKSSPKVTDEGKLTASPLNVLVNLLLHLSTQEDSACDGISRNVFTRHLFVEYPDLSHRIFNFLANEDSMQTSMQTIKIRDFQDRVELILNNNTYEETFLFYMKMYCGVKDYVTAEEFNPIATVAYNIFMDNHPQGPQICPDGISAVQNLVEALFHKQTELKTTELQHVIERDCPYLINILHSYVTNKLRIAYRELMELSPTKTEMVVEKSEDAVSDPLAATVPLSKVWMLSTVLPRIYMHPFSRTSHPTNLDSYTKLTANIGHHDFNFPAHWCLLYNSAQNGINPEILLSNLLHYKGPTLMFILGKHDKDFCLCISEEWREAPTFWGNQDCYLIQFSPVFRTILKGPRIVYMNFNTLSGHRGIQIGKDITNPAIVINSSLDRITFNGKKTKLHKIEVWGCGLPQVRDLQLEIKKWNSEENYMKDANESVDSVEGNEKEILQKDEVINNITEPKN